MTVVPARRIHIYPVSSLFLPFWAPLTKLCLFFVLSCVTRVRENIPGSLQLTSITSKRKLLRGLGMRLQRCLSVVSCPDHVRRRGLVSQVQILGLAPEAWSGQSNCRAAFIGIMWEVRTSISIIPLKVMLWNLLSNTEQFVIYTNNYKVSTLPQAPRIQVCDARPFPRERVGSGHETSLSVQYRYYTH